MRLAFENAKVSSVTKLPPVARQVLRAMERGGGITPPARRPHGKGDTRQQSRR